VSLPSASSLQLAVKCPGAWVYRPVENINDSAELGTMLHADLAAAVGGAEKVDHQAFVDSALEKAGDMLRGALIEPSYRWRWNGVVEFLGLNLGRNYPPKVGLCIDGTADYVKVTGSHVMVIDLKTGQTELPPVAKLEQMRFLALVAARHHLAETAQTAIIHAPRDGRQPWVEVGPVYTLSELDAIELQISRAVGNITASQKLHDSGETPKLTTGSHCRYCKVMTSCPAATGLLRTMATGEASTTLKLLTPEDARTALERLESIRAVVAAATSQLYSYAATNPIQCADGQVFGPHEVAKRAVVDGGRAFEFLKALYGEEVALEAVEFAASKSSITAAVSKVAEKGKKASLARDVIKSLSDEGIIESGGYKTEVGMYYPKGSKHD
jgi:hypothetical protein